MYLLRLAYFLRTAFQRGAALFLNPHVSTKRKVLALIAALFVLSPLNILGDIPFLGIFDDVVLLGFVLNWFVNASERELFKRQPPARPGSAILPTS